ncbi:hypothetical protein SEA_FRANCOB_201 [Streptomyces phage Francob]
MAKIAGASPKNLIMRAEMLIDSLPEYNADLKAEKAELLLRLASTKMEFMNQPEE